MDNSMQATVIGTRGSAIKPGQVQGIHLDRADNGWILRIETKLKPVKSDVPSDWDAGTERELYTDVDSLLARIKSACEQKPDKKAAKK